MSVGLWPGVVAVTGDADMLCVPCATKRYGSAAVDRVVWGPGESKPGYPTDDEGNPLGAVLADSEDAIDIDNGGTVRTCGKCGDDLE